MSQIHWLLYASSVNFAPFHKMCHSFEASAQKLPIDVTGGLSVSVVADPLQIHVLGPSVCPACNLPPLFLFNFAAHFKLQVFLFSCRLLLELGLE